jgi:hypothetical protein
MMGSAGIYRAHNIEKNKSRALSVQEWFDKCQDDAFAPPSIKTYERDSKELKAAHAAARQEKAEREKRKKEEARAKREKSKSERMKREEDRQRLASQATEGADGMKHEVPELDPASSGSSRSSEPAKTPELEPLDPWYESVDLKTAWLPKNATEEDYTDEACSKLQEKYWKTMGLGEPSWYGADLMQGESHWAHSGGVQADTQARFSQTKTLPGTSHICPTSWTESSAWCLALMSHICTLACGVLRLPGMWKM